MRKSRLMRLFSGTTKSTPCSLRSRPTTRRCARSSTSTILPSGRPLRSMPEMRAMTRSPCSTFLHLAGTEKEIGPAFLAYEKAVAVGMAVHDAAHEIELGDDADRVASVAHDLAVALHRGEPPLECVALGALHFQQLGELVLGHRHALLVQRVEDVFAARQRLVVALALALVMRIARAPPGLRRRAPHAPRGSSFLLALHLYPWTRSVKIRSAPRWRNW